MRCKKHAADASGAVGVCASCLRERLFALMAAQARVQEQEVLDHHRKSDTQLPPVPLPRSVSPYIPRRESAATSQPHGYHQRFNSTPLVGPAAVAIENTAKKNKKNFSSLFSGLFKSGSGPGLSCDSCTASPSWFSTIISGRRRNQNRTFSLDEAAISGERRIRPNCDRGLSPARCSDEDDDDGHLRAGSSGYSSESSQGWMQTPRRTPATARRGGGRNAGHSRNVSGLAFCLSPLVRASPNRHWNQKGLPPEIVVVAGETRKAQTSPFCKNRSRKLADFGRQSYNTRRR